MILEYKILMIILMIILIKLFLNSKLDLIWNCQICQTAVYNSNQKRRESITLEPGKMEACYSELVLGLFTKIE